MICPLSFHFTIVCGDFLSELGPEALVLSYARRAGETVGAEIDVEGHVVCPSGIMKPGGPIVDSDVPSPRYPQMTSRWPSEGVLKESHLTTRSP
jgi:hypothetical protein